MNKEFNSQKKAEILMEALPYIKRYHGKTLVIKYGGKAMITSELQRSVMTDIALLKLVGVSVIIVHGGGPQISEHLRELSIEPKFIDGLRVTDKRTMEVVRMVMVGKVNRELVSLLNAHGLRAIGLSGEDANLLVAEKIDTKRELGFVGKVKEVNNSMLASLLLEGYLPVIASIGIGEEGSTYNLNADHVASVVASALSADKLIFLTDVNGVFIEKEPGKKEFVSTLTVPECRRLVEIKMVSEGMVPKLLGCADAVEKGVDKAHILNGTIEHALLLEIFTDEGIGTMVVSADGGDVV